MGKQAQIMVVFIRDYLNEVTAEWLSTTARP
jgi:hypothetical protein